LQESIYNSFCEVNKKMDEVNDLEDYNDYEEDYEGYQCPFCGYDINSDGSCGC